MNTDELKTITTNLPDAPDPNRYLWPTWFCRNCKEVAPHWDFFVGDIRVRVCQNCGLSWTKYGGDSAKKISPELSAAIDEWFTQLNQGRGTPTPPPRRERRNRT